MDPSSVSFPLDDADLGIEPFLRVAIASVSQPPLTLVETPLLDRLHGIDRGSGPAVDPIAAEARRILSDDFLRRLQRAEVEVEAMTQAEREGVADWLGGMLHRPPLERPTAAFRPMRALVEALWWDLADRTPADPDDPDAGNPRLDAAHPWGEGPDQ